MPIEKYHPGVAELTAHTYVESPGENWRVLAAQGVDHVLRVAMHVGIRMVLEYKHSTLTRLAKLFALSPR